MSGGGTAGHVYPALAVAGLLREGGRDEVVFVGAPDGLEAALAVEAGLTFRGLAARGFDRSRPLSLLTSGLLLALSTVRAIALVLRFRPHVVIGFGGYVSIPVGAAAGLLGVPLALHEQNSVPGLANRILSRFAEGIAVTYPGSERHLRHPDRATRTGNPVRPQILAAGREEGRARLGFGPEDVVLLVFGGSRGARHLNEATLALYPRLKTVPRLRVLHVAGRIEAASVAQRLSAIAGPDPGFYRVADYVEGMGDALAAADLVVARAGATSIAEIAAVGRPSVLVPYPFATDDHQRLNAEAVERAGAAVVIADEDLDGEAYARVVLGLLMDAERRDGMATAARKLGRRDAAEAVSEMARSVAAGSWSTETAHERTPT